MDVVELCCANLRETVGGPEAHLLRYGANARRYFGSQNVAQVLIGRVATEKQQRPRPDRWRKLSPTDLVLLHRRLFGDRTRGERLRVDLATRLVARLFCLGADRIGGANPP